MRRTAYILPSVLICLVFTVGAVAAFPEMDDTYLLLLLKEHGAGAIIPGHPDRPIVAALWYGLASVSGKHFWTVGLGFHFLLWLLLAVETATLWRRLFPMASRYLPLVAALAVAPIIVRTQLSTITIDLLGLLTTVLGYGAVCALLCNHLWRGLPLMLGACLLSEYAVPVAAAGGVILYANGRRRSSVLLATTAILGYACFRMMTASAGRANTTPSYAFQRNLLAAPWALVSRSWRVAAGAYGDAVGRVSPTWSGKSTIVAFCFGLLSAWLLVRLSGVFKDRDGPAYQRRGLRTTRALWIALAAGLVPISLMREVQVGNSFATRFDLPIIPIAVVVTLYCSLEIVRQRYHWLMVAVVGVVIGYMTVDQTWAGYREQRIMDRVGQVFRTRVAASGGCTVAVMNADTATRGGYALTSKITSKWPSELEERVWVLDGREARPETLLTGQKLDISIRGIVRSCPIAKVIQVTVAGENITISDPAAVFPKATD